GGMRSDSRLPLARSSRGRKRPSSVRLIPRRMVLLRKPGLSTPSIRTRRVLRPSWPPPNMPPMPPMPPPPPMPARRLPSASNSSMKIAQPPQRLAFFLAARTIMKTDTMSMPRNIPEKAEEDREVGQHEDQQLADREHQLQQQARQQDQGLDGAEPEKHVGADHVQRDQEEGDQEPPPEDVAVGLQRPLVGVLLFRQAV